MSESVCVWCRGRGYIEAGEIRHHINYVTSWPWHECPDCDGLGLRCHA